MTIISDNRKYIRKIVIGNATLYHGDCLKILPTLEMVDAIVSDPPYGITSNKWDRNIDLSELWNKMNAAVYIFTASQPFTSQLVMSNLELFKHEWIWIKNRGSNFANTVREPMKEHESVLVFSPGKWTYNKQMQERTASGDNRVKYDVAFRTKSENYHNFSDKEPKLLPKLRVPSSWQKFNVEVGSHPTQKPVSLIEYMVNTYSNSGETILDPFMGSGTHGVACMNLGRNFIGIEIDKDYFNVACERIDQAQRQQRLFS